MQPYRLEMGLRFNNRVGKNLYEFWGNDISDAVQADLKKSGSPLLINLASNEYFKSVNAKTLDAEIITPVFKDLKQGKYKMISFFAKKARGLMARFIIDRQLNNPEGLKEFDAEGYYFSKTLSTASELVFLRDKPPGA
jgi:cytoplasmic iron level regulating protein YaaA (DUF328/UPF0246 family)